MGDPYVYDVYKDYGPGTVEVNLNGSDGSWYIDMYGGLVKRTIGSPRSGIFATSGGTYVFKVTVFEYNSGFYGGNANERGINPVGYQTTDTGWTEFSGYTNAIRIQTVGYESAFIRNRYRLEIAKPGGTVTFHDMSLEVSEV
jgi:hypothetical protein